MMDLPAYSPAVAAEMALRYARNARAAATRRAYRSDFLHFQSYCTAIQQNSLPALPQTVAFYLSHLASSLNASIPTLHRRLAAIRHAHILANLISPTGSPEVRLTFSGIRRAHGAPPVSKRALSVDQLRSLLVQTSPDLQGLRDRALLLIGFAGALRRSELTALQFNDVEFTSEGIVLTIRRSKTDPFGEGKGIGIPFGRHPESCPVAALRAWLSAASINSGPLFRPIPRWSNQPSPHALGDYRVCGIVQRLARLAGFTDYAQFGAHSLRSGLATAAAQAGASERDIMDQTRHKSLQTLRRYIRRGSLFHNNPAAAAGL